MISFLKSFYDKSYHNMPAKRVAEYKKAVETNYRYLSEKYGKSYFDVDLFLERYEKAVKKKFNMYEFFKLEIDAIDTFLNRIKEAEAKQKNSLTNFFDRVHREEKEENSTFSATEQLYWQFQEKIRCYPQIAIHDNASEEIERLLGCLLDFEKKIYAPFLEIEKWLRKDANLHEFFQQTKVIFEDLVVIHKNKFPFVFANYKFKVENAEGDDNLIELADINVLKKVVDLMKRLKKLTTWFTNPSLEGYSNSTLNYGDQKISFDEFKTQLKIDCNKVLRNFRLDSF